jgi:hypothetical protein
MALLGLLFAGAAAFVTSAAIAVPVRRLALVPVLTRSQITVHWPMAVAVLGFVVAVDALVLGLGFRNHAAALTGSSPVTSADRAEVRGRGPLRIQSAPPWALLTTASVSFGVLAGTIFLGLPSWEMALATLIPWIPLLAFEEIWKYKHYGFYAVFLGLAALQVGHLGEHTVQVSQLLLYHGDLSRSHGVFGQLDFETVHFVWDTLIWGAGALLVYRFWDNKWLWISWFAASVHQMEHLYLFGMYRLDPAFWAHGGIAGIMGKGGLVGSPLARPYLHFAYNFLVVIPMLVGLWDETKRVRDRSDAGIDRHEG